MSCSAHLLLDSLGGLDSWERKNSFISSLSSVDLLLVDQQWLCSNTINYSNSPMKTWNDFLCRSFFSLFGLLFLFPFPFALAMRFNYVGYFIYLARFSIWWLLEKPNKTKAHARNQSKMETIVKTLSCFSFVLVLVAFNRSHFCCVCKTWKNVRLLLMTVLREKMRRKANEKTYTKNRILILWQSVQRNNSSLYWAISVDNKINKKEAQNAKGKQFHRVYISNWNHYLSRLIVQPFSLCQAILTMRLWLCVCARLFFHAFVVCAFVLFYCRDVNCLLSRITSTCCPCWNSVRIFPLVVGFFSPLILSSTANVSHVRRIYTR